MRVWYSIGPVIAAALLVLTVAPRAQQPAVPAGRGQVPGAPPAGGRGAPTAPPPIQWSTPPPPDGPVLLDTGVQHQVRVVPTKGLNQPWGLAFLPDGGILVTERPGRLRLVRNGVLDPKPIAGVPQVQAAGLAGLMDVALHPRFVENQLVYLTYHKPSATVAAQTIPAPPGANAPGTITLARGRWDGTALVDVKDIFSAVPSGNASRMVFGKDGMIYMGVGYGDPPVGNVNPAGAPPQDPNNLSGKMLRLKDDGSVPPDNPFVGRAGYRPEIFTLGHRNIMGLAVNPLTGDVWENENGPNGGDEINVLQPGKNYGWPVVSTGRFYLGPRVNDRFHQDGMEQPIVFWVPAIAVSGMTFYTGDRFPNWKGHVFVGGLRRGEVPRSGHLERIDFNERWEELHRESLLQELQQRIRDVKQGPDGLLYLLTGENDGALLRLEPAPAPPAPAGRGGR